MDDEATGSSSRPAAPGRRRRLESVQEARSARRTAVRWGLSFVLAVLLVSALIGEHGYVATLRLRNEQRALEASLARLRVENGRLQDDAARLRTEPAALEEAARRELGLIRPGETLVILRDTRPVPPSPGR